MDTLDVATSNDAVDSLNAAASAQAPGDEGRNVPTLNAPASVTGQAKDIPAESKNLLGQISAPASASAPEEESTNEPAASIDHNVSRESFMMQVRSRDEMQDHEQCLGICYRCRRNNSRLVLKLQFWADVKTLSTLFPGYKVLWICRNCLFEESGVSFLKRMDEWNYGAFEVCPPALQANDVIFESLLGKNNHLLSWEFDEDKKAPQLVSVLRMPNGSLKKTKCDGRLLFCMKAAFEVNNFRIPLLSFAEEFKKISTIGAYSSASGDLRNVLKEYCVPAQIEDIEFDQSSTLQFCNVRPEVFFCDTLSGVKASPCSILSSIVRNCGPSTIRNHRDEVSFKNPDDLRDLTNLKSEKGPFLKEWLHKGKLNVLDTCFLKWIAESCKNGASTLPHGEHGLTSSMNFLLPMLKIFGQKQNLISTRNIWEGGFVHDRYPLEYLKCYLDSFFSSESYQKLDSTWTDLLENRSLVVQRPGQVITTAFIPSKEINVSRHMRLEDVRFQLHKVHSFAQGSFHFSIATNLPHHFDMPTTYSVAAKILQVMKPSKKEWVALGRMNSFVQFIFVAHSESVPIDPGFLETISTYKRLLAWPEYSAQEKGMWIQSCAAKTSTSKSFRTAWTYQPVKLYLRGCAKEIEYCHRCGCGLFDFLFEKDGEHFCWICSRDIHQRQQANSESGSSSSSGGKGSKRGAAGGEVRDASDVLDPSPKRQRTKAGKSSSSRSATLRGANEQAKTSSTSSTSLRVPSEKGRKRGSGRKGTDSDDEDYAPAETRVRVLRSKK
eukprot:TRINITY_DN28655_c0_g1_i1.p1 TRINITY_DN28655_c0_g1~~TRINITY_DN28655_c0_g1_i1.p1  ORF type:complete len:776 (+),score=124.16 TRINITY_DN28655_c0_g1_i1:87-2414(+)